MSDLIGKEFGAYRILEQIGAGGMATVYKAYHAAMDRHVAVKVLPEQMGLKAEFRKRFDREAKVIARLEHAHILPVHDYGQAGSRLYLVMRYIEAGTLKDRLDAGLMGLTEVNRIVHQVGGALEYAHRLGVVHRDVKPANVLLDAQGSCYLTDFGLARMMEDTAKLTATGVGMGTPAYMSPEQGKGEKVDARSDIYSLGVMLYEMVTGRVPYEAETPMAVVLKHITAPLPLPSKAKPGIPARVERVILKALAKNPDDRFQTVAEMVAAFDAAVRLAGPELQLEVSAPPAEGFLARLTAGLRNATQTGWGRAVVWAAMGAVALLVFFLVLSRVPLKVQIKGGQLEVVRVVEATVTPEAAAVVATATQTVTAKPTATNTSSRPTFTLAAVATSTSQPASTATPPLVPTLQPTPTATASPTTGPTNTPAPPSASWQRIEDLPRRINSLVVDPTDAQVWYAGAGTGVYKSEDAGLTWQLITNGLPKGAVKALAFSHDLPPTLYADIEYEGIYASVDGASSWTQVVARIPSSCSGCGRQMFVSPDDSRTLFIVEERMPALRSRDGGQNWLPVADEQGEIEAFSLVIDPTDANVIYLGTEENGVYKSTDGGETWAAANRGMLDYGITALAVDPAQPQTVYAGEYNGELFKSTDGGASWHDFTAKLPFPEHSYPGSIQSLVVDPAAPGTVYLLCERAGVAVSDDGGESWRVLGKPGEVENPWFTGMTVLFDPQLLLLVGINDEGGWRYVVD